MISLGVAVYFWLPEPPAQTPASSSWLWAELYSPALGFSESEAPAAADAPTPADAGALTLS